MDDWGLTSEGSSDLVPTGTLAPPLVSDPCQIGKSSSGNSGATVSRSTAMLVSVLQVSDLV